MHVELVSVDAPDRCARCLGQPTQPFEIQIGKNPKRADNLLKFTVQVCDECRRKTRTALVALIAPAGGLLLVGLVWSMMIESAAPIVLAGVGAIVAIFVTGPLYRQAHPLVLDDGPVRFRNAQYNELFAELNAPFITELNAARGRASSSPKRGIPILMQSILRGGVYTGLFAIVVGFRTPAMLIGGIALALICGAVLVALTPK